MKVECQLAKPSLLLHCLEKSKIMLVGPTAVAEVSSMNRDVEADHADHRQSILAIFEEGVETQAAGQDGVEFVLLVEDLSSLFVDSAVDIE